MSQRWIWLKESKVLETQMFNYESQRLHPTSSFVWKQTGSSVLWAGNIQEEAPVFISNQRKLCLGLWQTGGVTSSELWPLNRVRKHLKTLIRENKEPQEEPQRRDSSFWDGQTGHRCHLYRTTRRCDIYIISFQSRVVSIQMVLDHPDQDLNHTVSCPCRAQTDETNVWDKLAKGF